MRLASGPMASQIAVITDSTAGLPGALAGDLHVASVPVEVIVNGLPYEEGVDISTAAIAAALRRGDDVSTSRPAPQAFLDEYRRAAERGATGVVSAHLSRRLSGTYQSAVIASRDAPIPVEVVDSRTACMALGYAVIAGARVAAIGGRLHEVTSAIRRRASATRVFFYVDTLEFLRRGGRIGAASALLGTALRMKPILTVADGEVRPLEKARTTAKALSRLGEMAVASAGSGPVDVCVQDVDTPGRSRALVDCLSKQLSQARVMQGSIGAVVGSHVGPGAIAVVVAPHV